MECKNIIDESWETKIYILKTFLFQLNWQPTLNYDRQRIGCRVTQIISLETTDRSLGRVGRH